MEGEQPLCRLGLNYPPTTVGGICSFKPPKVSLRSFGLRRHEVILRWREDGLERELCLGADAPDRIRGFSVQPRTDGPRSKGSAPFFLFGSPPRTMESVSVHPGVHERVNEDPDG